MRFVCLYIDLNSRLPSPKGGPPRNLRSPPLPEGPLKSLGRAVVAAVCTPEGKLSLGPRLLADSGQAECLLPEALKLIMTPDRLLKSVATNVNKIKAT